MKKSVITPISSKRQKEAPPSISICGDELARLHDIADGLQLLRDIMEEAPGMHLIQAQILIRKTSQCAWNLIHEVLDSRWQECQPDVELIQK
jgi:hypothetical protein